MAASAGSLIDCVLHSRALCRFMRLHLYLPPGYDEGHGHYPVVYLLHPWGEDEHYWTAVLRVHEVADRLIAAGTLPPFIAAMPQGDKSFFINAADPGGDFSMVQRLDPDFFAGALEGYGDYGDYVLEDVIPYVERTFRARRGRSARAIAGISMGGTGAAVLAFTHPQMFSAVGIHSPALFSDQRLGPPWIFGLGDEEAFAERDPVHLARRLKPHISPRILLDCGQQDEFMLSVEELRWTLIERSIHHTFITGPGGHSPDYWQAHLAEYLGFYAAGW